MMLYSTKISNDCVRPRFYVSFFCLLSLFLVLSGTPVFSGTIELPQTGQTICYNVTGNEIPCDGTGQDGDFLAGVAWPLPRFEVDATGACIMDNLTGLMWSRNAWNLTYQTSWAASVLNPPNAFFTCGFFDWRLPNINELQSLINFEEPDYVLWLALQGFFFLNIDPIIYWSSTSSADTPEADAWNINMIDGSVAAEPKSTPYLIWPVRGTSNPAKDLPPGQITETGQLASQASYDDAYFAAPGRKVGIPWPDPRFTQTYCDSTGPCADQEADCDIDSSNNIVTDNLTGLAWSADANLDGLKTWSNALLFADSLNICGYGDWRLPNSKELISLIDRSHSEPALPAGHPFAHVQSGVDDFYWSSTSYASDPEMAWILHMLHGASGAAAKTDTAYAWPVRGGQTKPYVLTVKKEGTGRGKVAAPDLSCAGTTCTGYYASHEEVIVTATPLPGSVFTEWTDCPSPSGDTCTLTITDDITIKATFLPEYKITVSPRSLNFKNLKQGVSSPPLTVTVTNAGASPLQITSIDIIGDDASVFSFIDDCPAELTSLDDFCTISVTAVSDTYDTRQAQLQITSSDTKKPISIVRLRAKAKPARITRKPASLNFGKVPFTSSASKTLTITNKGVTDLIIGSCMVIGDHPGDFFPFLSDTCSGSTLETGETCALAVTFAPAATGKRSAILQVPSNDPKTLTLSVKVKGTGE